MTAGRMITAEKIAAFGRYLYSEERGSGTIGKYLRDVRAFAAWLGGHITGFRFRDKTTGWGLNIQVVYQDAIGNVHKKQIPAFRSSYYKLFLNSELYRDSCYSCPYAGKQHPADLTVGDFWGIEEEHPEALAPDGEMDMEKGVSVLIVNTETGAEWFDRCRDEFFCVPSTLEKAARHNGQLRRPSIPGEGRAQILALYQAEGYDAVEDAFARKNRAAQWKGWIRYHLRSSIPAPIRRWMKKIIRGIRRRRLPGRL